MNTRLKDFINTYDSLIDSGDWDELLTAAHEEALLRQREVDALVLLLESTLDIDLYNVQCDLFLKKLKAVIKAGNPDQSTGYRNAYGAIKLKPWLLSKYWTNLYGLSLDDALGVCIDNFNVENTPDEGTLMWIE